MRPNNLATSFFFLFLTAGVSSFSLHQNITQSVSWPGASQVALGLEIERSSESLSLSIVSELPRRLSVGAHVIVEKDPDFDEVNARYTDYKRPVYIAGVQVQEEKDVIETVRIDLDWGPGPSKTDTCLGQLRPSKKHPVCRSCRRAFVDYLIEEHPERNCD